jgi:hypothetical protein
LFFIAEVNVAWSAEGDEVVDVVFFGGSAHTSGVDVVYVGGFFVADFAGDEVMGCEVHFFHVEFDVWFHSGVRFEV